MTNRRNRFNTREYKIFIHGIINHVQYWKNVFQAFYSISRMCVIQLIKLATTTTVIRRTPIPNYPIMCIIIEVCVCMLRRNVSILISKKTKLQNIRHRLLIIISR